MPQFDKFSFFNQLFWLFVTFFFFYLIFIYYFLPYLIKTLKYRKKILVAKLENKKTYEILFNIKTKQYDYNYLYASNLLLLQQQTNCSVFQINMQSINLFPKKLFLFNFKKILMLNKIINI